MTKYKLNNTVRSSTEVTLTSYNTGGTDSGRKDDRCQISEVDSNQNDSKVESNRNLPNKLFDSGLAASLVKQECNKFGLNELRVDNLDRNVCLCEKYNGGCKLCPRPSLATTMTLGGGKECPTCPGPCAPYSKPGFLDVSFSKSAEESEHGWRRRIARRARGCCSRKTLVRRVPMLGWIPEYTLRNGLADMIAGVTVGLTIIPQAIAYAGVAGLPPQFGLYSSFMACFVYTVFGSVKDSAIGPTAIAAILTRENLHGLGPEFAVLLCFLSGCVELLMGILQLGFLIDFISGPVSVGFTSAAAIIIATSQVKDILGLSFPGGKFLQVWSGLYEHIGETRLWDTVLGVSCIVVLLLLRKVKDIKVPGSDVESPSRGARLAASALWFLSTTRNIIVVLACAALAYYFDTTHQAPFRLTGEVKPGLPEFRPPPFSAEVGNHTYTFVEMSSTLGSAIFVVPLLSILENIALAKVFSVGEAVDATQEMVALGLCNIVASFAQSMPVSGALSRGAVNHASGAATPAGGIYTGALVLLALQYFTPYFLYIPKASLAAVIISAVVFMMELHIFKPIWKVKKLDIVPGLVTFVTCLALRLELGIVAGVAVNLALLLFAAARPKITVDTKVSLSGIEYRMCSIELPLWFPAAQHVRRAVRRAAAGGGGSGGAGAGAGGAGVLVLDATRLARADYTAAQGLKSLQADFASANKCLIFFRPRPALLSALRRLPPTAAAAPPPLVAYDEVQLDEILKDVGKGRNVW